MPRGRRRRPVAAGSHSEHVAGGGRFARNCCWIAMMAGWQSQISLVPIEGPGSSGSARHGKREESREFQLSRKCEFEKRHPHGCRISRQQSGFDAEKWQRLGELAENEPPFGKSQSIGRELLFLVRSSSTSLSSCWSCACLGEAPPLIRRRPLWRGGCGGALPRNCPDVAQRWVSKMAT